MISVPFARCHAGSVEKEYFDKLCVIVTLLEFMNINPTPFLLSQINIKSFAGIEGLHWFGLKLEQ